MAWCEIFKAGKHVDRKGKQREWTIQDLDRIIQTYDPIHYHEAPIVIDHNEENGPVRGGPAYGWVEGLKRVGSTLYAKFKQVVPEFKELVNQGIFKKRSIGVRPNGTLLHVSFLGAAPPAIKGLKDFAFSGSESEECLCYSEDATKINEEEPVDMNEVERLKKELADSKAREAQLGNELAEKETELKGKDHEFAEFRGTALRKELEAELDVAIKEKRALPAWKDAGIVEFMEKLDSSEGFEFSEGKKETQLDWFRKFLTGLGEHSLFSEFADKNKAKDRTSEFSEGSDKLVEMMVSAGNGGK